jgi:hypothetical protein
VNGGGKRDVLVGSSNNPPGFGSGPFRVANQLMQGFSFAPPPSMAPGGEPEHALDLISASAGKFVLYRERNVLFPALSSLHLAKVDSDFFGVTVNSLVSVPQSAVDSSFTAGQSATNSGVQWVFSWTRGNTTLRFRTLSTPAVGIVTFGTESTYTMPMSIAQASLITRAGDAPLVAVSLDHGSVVKLYDFDGTTLTLKNSLTPPGGRKASGLIPWGNSDGFAMLTRAGLTGPSTQVTRYQPDVNGDYVPVDTDGLPPVARRASGNVFAWHGHPLLNDDATLLGARRAGDWTTSVNNGPTLEAVGETYVSREAGLGSAATLQVGVEPVTTSHRTVNQLSATLSSYLFDGALDASAISAKVSPQGGRFAASTLNVTFTWSGSGFLAGFYKINNGAWTAAGSPGNGGGSFTIPLSGTSTLQLMAQESSTFGVPRKSRLITQVYTLGALPETPMSGVDADGDGLIDEWEKLFGITEPTGDADGDGVSNFAEHNAGTDPQNAQSTFTPPPTLPELTIGVVPQGEGGAYCICATWPTNDPSVRLETSTSLGATAVWTVVTTSISVAGDQYVFTTLPTPGESARFFRLARY